MDVYDRARDASCMMRDSVSGVIKVVLRSRVGGSPGLVRKWGAAGARDSGGPASGDTWLDPRTIRGRWMHVDLEWGFTSPWARGRL